jgi:hypothetical protein
MTTLHDVERAPVGDDSKKPNVEVGMHQRPGAEVNTGGQSRVGGLTGILNLLAKRGEVELRGCTPVPYDERTETNYVNIFTLWFSMSCNPLP